jgi:hypothetical protein
VLFRPEHIVDLSDERVQTASNWICVLDRRLQHVSVGNRYTPVVVGKVASSSMSQHSPANLQNHTNILPSSSVSSSWSSLSFHIPCPLALLVLLVLL